MVTKYLTPKITKSHSVKKSEILCCKLNFEVHFRKRKNLRKRRVYAGFGADSRTRTDDLLITNLLRAGSGADLYMPIWQFGSQPSARVCCEIRFFKIAGDFVRPAVRFCFCAGVAIFLLIFSARYSIILAVLQRSTLC